MMKKTVSIVTAVVMLFVGLFGSTSLTYATTRTSNHSAYIQTIKIVEQKDGGSVVEVETSWHDSGDYRWTGIYEKIQYDRTGREMNYYDSNGGLNGQVVTPEADSEYSDITTDVYYLNGRRDFYREYYYVDSYYGRNLETTFIQYDERGRESKYEEHSYSWNDSGDLIYIDDRTPDRNRNSYYDHKNDYNNYSYYNHSDYSYSSWYETWFEEHSGYNYNYDNRSTYNYNNYDYRYNNHNNNRNSSNYSYGLYNTWRTFNDVDPNEWYHDYIEAAVDRGLMKGYGDGRFGPDDYVSRAEVNQMLYNVSGSVPMNARQIRSYYDIDPNAWFANAIYAMQAAIGEGSGIETWSDGRVEFHPNDPATREYIIWGLSEICYYGKLSFLNSTKSFGGFPDIYSLDGNLQSNINNFASHNIINGDGSGNFQPYGYLKRGEAAKILLLFDDYCHPSIRK